MMQVIDSYIEKAKEIGISSLFTVWSKASDCVNVLVIRMIHMVGILLARVFSNLHSFGPFLP